MKIEQLFAEVFAMSAENIHDDLELKAIPTWDSMSHMILIDRLESTFMVQLTGDEIADMATIGDARRAIQSHGWQA
jgi:acyl carrier protein